MSTAGWITMIVILGIVWGGFATILATALRKESHKNDVARR